MSRSCRAAGASPQEPPASAPARSSPCPCPRGDGGPSPFVGFAVLDRLLADRPRRSRLARGWLFGVGWLASGHGLDVVPDRARLPRRRRALRRSTSARPAPSPRPGAGAGSACRRPSPWPKPLRFVFPFEGVPLASLGDRPGRRAARAARPHRRRAAAHLVTVGLGVALSAALRRRWRAGRGARSGRRRPASSWPPSLAPQGHQVDTARIALVQGGGPQGTRAIDTDPREVVRAPSGRHPGRWRAPSTWWCGPRT